MKFFETTFNDYITTSNNMNLHPTFSKTIDTFPNDITNLKNVIFYGPSGTGKYTQVLQSIKKYSPSELKYEKKLICTYNKSNYFFKISDIHFEVDMSLLGCNARLLWNELFINIIDVISSRTNKNGIILCKNFHKIHTELLDCFYSYVQKNYSCINLVFFILTEHISFIPDSILNTCYTVTFSRPSKNAYNKIIKKKLPTSLDINEITNIKNLMTTNIILNNNVSCYIKKLYSLMINEKEIKYTQFRDVIYDIFIYDIEIGHVIYGLLRLLFTNNDIKKEQYSYVFLESYSFLQYYNNNYRPIYHLENYLYKLINLVHEF